MGSINSFHKKVLPEMALNFLVHASKNLLSRYTLRAAIRAQARRIFTGSREKPYKPVPVVEDWADRIMEIFLRNRSSFPNSICIDGPPGSGKSTLGRALAERCGLKWRTIYWREIKGPYPFKPGRIYENIRLIRTQDREQFDWIVYVDCSTEDAKTRVISRDRDAALVDIVDFTLLKRIGDTAFAMLDGEETSIPGSPLKIKMRPERGYRDLDELKMRLWDRNIDTERFSKEELLFIYCYGKPKCGILPYLKLGAYNKEIFSGFYDALVTYLGTRLLT